MSTLLTNIGTILSNLLTWLSQVASYLITNPIFLILLAVGIFSLLFYAIKTLVHNVKSKPTYPPYSKNRFDTPVKEWTDEMYDEDAEWSFLNSEY